MTLHGTVKVFSRGIGAMGQSQTSLLKEGVDSLCKQLERHSLRQRMSFYCSSVEYLILLS